MGKEKSAILEREEIVLNQIAKQNDCQRLGTGSPG